MKTELSRFTTDELITELLARDGALEYTVFKRVGSLFGPAHYAMISIDERTKAEALTNKDFDRSRDFLTVLIA